MSYVNTRPPGPRVLDFDGARFTAVKLASAGELLARAAG